MAFAQGLLVFAYSNIERGLVMLDSLPQSAILKASDIERWQAWMKRNEPDRLQWHVARLRGFGGSDSGAVVRGLTERSGSGFSSLDKVIEQKLLRRMPLKADENMRRGTVLEELARLATQYRYGAAIDAGASSAMRQATPRKGYEWLVGNEDDFLLIGGRRFVADYKVPSSYSDHVDFDYECQLHHYNLKARMAGIKTDGLLLVKLDLAAELGNSLANKFPSMSEAEKHNLAKLIATTDVPGMRVVALGVEHSRALDVDILDACSYAWTEYVLKGVVPAADPRRLHHLNEAQTVELANLQQQYALAKSGISYLDSIVKQAETGLKEILAGVDVTKEKLAINLINIKPKNHDKALLISEAKALGALPEDLQPDKPSYSVQALVDEIKRLNGDVEAQHLFEQKEDAAKAKSYLESLGTVDMDSLRGEGLSISLSRKEKDMKQYAGMSEEAGTVIAPWLDSKRIEHEVSGDQQDSDHYEQWDSAAATGMQQNEATAEAGISDDQNQIPMSRMSLR